MNQFTKVAKPRAFPKRRKWWHRESVIDFGKYAGKDMTYVLDVDPAYLEWFCHLDGFEIDPALRDDISAALVDGAFEKALDFELDMDFGEYMGGHF